MKDGLTQSPASPSSLSAKPEVVVITGATAGVGRATAHAFARRGAKIALLARGAEGLASTREAVENLGARAIAIPTDVADPEQVEQAASTAERDLGPIDIWINNAMTTVFAPVREITAAEFKRATEVTYLGAVHGTMSALRRMAPRNRGTIVQVGSALAYRSIPLQSAYCGAKHAIRGFTDSLRSELLHDGVSVHLTMVQLPALNTPQFEWCRTRLPRHPQPVPPIFEPEIAAEAIYWGAHSNRREIYVGNSTVKAITGNKIAPGLLDWYLAKTGYNAQQTPDPVDQNRPDNLFEPVAGKHRTRGIFSSCAKDSSPELWAAKHKDWLGAAASAVAGLALFGWLTWRH